MRVFVLLLVLMTGLNATAAGRLEKLIASDIQNLVNDTVNEGEHNAEVIFRNGKPEVNCKLSDNRKESSFKWAYCQVTFQVKFRASTEERACALLYTFNPRSIKKSLKQGPEHFFQTCLENLNEGFE